MSHQISPARVPSPGPSSSMTLFVPHDDERGGILIIDGCDDEGQCFEATLKLKPSLVKLIRLLHDVRSRHRALGNVPPAESGWTLAGDLAIAMDNDIGTIRSYLTILEKMLREAITRCGARPPGEVLIARERGLGVRLLIDLTIISGRDDIERS